jgi:hypothetical protein
MAYRLYVDEHYVRDFDDFAYAIAHSSLSKGIIVKGEGRPIGYIGDYARIKEGDIYLLSTYYPAQASDEEENLDIPEQTPEKEENPDTLERTYYEGYPVIHIKVEEEVVVGDVPAILLNDRTMVPLRLVSEALGATVEWDPVQFTVHIDVDGGIRGQADIEPMGTSYFKGLKMVNVVAGGVPINSDVPAVIINS